MTEMFDDEFNLYDPEEDERAEKEIKEWWDNLTEEEQEEYEKYYDSVLEKACENLKR